MTHCCDSCSCKMPPRARSSFRLSCKGPRTSCQKMPWKALLTSFKFCVSYSCKVRPEGLRRCWTGWCRGRQHSKPPCCCPTPPSPLTTTSGVSAPRRPPPSSCSRTTCPPGGDSPLAVSPVHVLPYCFGFARCTDYQGSDRSEKGERWRV